MDFLQDTLGAGPVQLTSRGYGTCRVWRPARAMSGPCSSITPWIRSFSIRWKSAPSRQWRLRRRMTSRIAPCVHPRDRGGLFQMSGGFENFGKRERPASTARWNAASAGMSMIRRKAIRLADRAGHGLCRSAGGLALSELRRAPVEIHGAGCGERVMLASGHAGRYGRRRSPQRSKNAIGTSRQPRWPTCRSAIRR